MPIKTTFVLCLGLTLLGAGCARNYVIKTTSGARVTSANKPKLDRGFYVFKDARGQTQYLSQGRVLEIAPASRANSDNRMFKPEPKR